LQVLGGEWLERGETAVAHAGTTIVIDYLQLLDQQRHRPALAEQVQALKAFARDKGVIVIFLSQIDRSYDLSNKPCPNIEDPRLPNPLDVGVFSKTCFLHEGTVELREIAGDEWVHGLA